MAASRAQSTSKYSAWADPRPARSRSHHQGLAFASATPTWLGTMSSTNRSPRSWAAAISSRRAGSPPRSSRSPWSGRPRRQPWFERPRRPAAGRRTARRSPTRPGRAAGPARRRNVVAAGLDTTREALPETGHRGTTHGSVRARLFIQTHAAGRKSMGHSLTLSLSLPFSLFLVEAEHTSTTLHIFCHYSNSLYIKTKFLPFSPPIYPSFHYLTTAISTIPT